MAKSSGQTVSMEIRESCQLHRDDRGISDRGWKQAYPDLYSLSYGESRGSGGQASVAEAVLYDPEFVQAESFDQAGSRR